MDDIKLIYALTCDMQPGTTHEWDDPITHNTMTWTVPADGVVLFYIGETTMRLKDRLSKHVTYTKKMLRHLNGELNINGLKHYPVYYFTSAFCGLNFNITLLQEDNGNTEQWWVEQARALGHPIQNSVPASTSIVKGENKHTRTAMGDYAKLNPKRVKPAPPSPEDIIRARNAWIAQRASKS